MVSERVVSPVLLLPQPLAAANKVCTKTKQIVPERTLGAGSVVGIVLDIHSDQRFRDAIDNRKSNRCSNSNPLILKVKEEGDVAEGPEEPSVRAKLLAATDDFENLSLYFAFKLSVELVAAKKKTLDARS